MIVGVPCESYPGERRVALVQEQTTAAGKAEAKPVRSATAEEAAAILAAANKVVIVPGYGMAVAQAQHKVRELCDALNKRGIDVKFGIHPVAGRMPRHMNVLLAEADIPTTNSSAWTRSMAISRKPMWRW